MSDYISREDLISTIQRNGIGTFEDMNCEQAERLMIKIVTDALSADVIPRDLLMEKLMHYLECDDRTLSNPISDNSLYYDGIYEAYKIVRDWGD